jgi:TolB protein
MKKRQSWWWLLLPFLAACGRDGHLKKGQQFLELGDLERAVQQFSQAVNVSPRNPEAHYGLAMAYCRSDSPGPAVREYRLLCRLSPALADDPLLRQKVAGFLGLEPYPSFRLTSARGNDAFPAFSADGRLIAFSSKRDGNTEIYLMDADGGSQKRLTNNRAIDYAPSFSPDGRMLAFVSDRDGNDEIYLLDLTSAAQRRLTYHSGEDALPAFSPDGGQVLFISDRDGKYRLCSAEAGGSGRGRESGLHRIFDDEYNKIHFSVWQGRLLVQEERENLVVLFTAPAEGGPKKPVNGPSFRAALPTMLSPDGSLLLYTSSRYGDDELFLYDFKRETSIRLTFSPAQEFGYGFSPDGSRLLFDSNRGGDRDIYLIRLDRLISREEILSAVERN